MAVKPEHILDCNSITIIPNDNNTAIIAAVIGAIAGAVGTAIVQLVIHYYRNKKYIENSMKQLGAILESVYEFNNYKKSGGIMPSKVNMLIHQLDGASTLSRQLSGAIFAYRKYASKEMYEALLTISGGCVRIIKELENNNWHNFKGRNRNALKIYLEMLKNAQNKAEKKR